MRGVLIVEQSPTVRLLTAERDLVPGDSIRPALRLLAVGNPDFDATTTSVMDAAAHRGPGPGCAAFGALVWRPLPETAGEIDDVMASWRVAAGDARGETVTRLAGPTADEASFKRFEPRASWIHVATHGFFLDAACVAVEPRTRGVGA